MTRTWVAVFLAALAATSSGRAGEFVPPPDPVPISAPAGLPAPGHEITPPGGSCGPAGCATPCNTPCATPCAKPCAAKHAHCDRCKKHDDRPCYDKLCDWLCYRSHRTKCGECRSCMDVYPPLYLYFVVPCCREGCYHVPACCPAPCCNDCHYANLLGPVCPPQGCGAGGCAAPCGGGCK